MVEPTIQTWLDMNVITRQQLVQATHRKKLHGGTLVDNLLTLGFISEREVLEALPKYPPMPTRVEETGLELSCIADLMNKHALGLGEFRLADMVDRIKLPKSIIDAGMEKLRRQKFVEVLGAASYSTDTYRFKITEQGSNRAMELFEQCRYAGPAPVVLAEYQSRVEQQTIRNVMINDSEVTQGFSHLVVTPELLRCIGPSISSAKSLFIYGPSGNGKTAIAEAIGAILKDPVLIPHALFVRGEIIRVYDPVNHHKGDVEPAIEMDQRWVLAKRPVIVTGGELTLRMLDLDFDPVRKYYEASLQMKANNGIFLVDDFGRQHVEPRALLNRWIIPLERRTDYMSLHTGMKFPIPFDMMVIFATNMEPQHLVDEAFLRRIRYKIRIGHPSPAEYEAIFRRVCDINGIQFDTEVFRYLLQRYADTGIPLTACHPRDIVEFVIDHSRYTGVPTRLTSQLIEEAWETYFVSK